jgi:hypothetical protein
MENQQEIKRPNVQKFTEYQLKKMEKKNIDPEVKQTLKKIDLDKKNEHEKNKEKEQPENEFPKLTLEEIETNLRLLGDLKEHEKLMIDGNFITVDQRYAQSLRRWLTEDSRRKAIYFIAYVISEANKICTSMYNDMSNGVDQNSNNLDKLMSFQLLIKGANNGLSKLSYTYNDDKLSKAKIETIQREIKTICDTDIRKIVNTKQK